jgi:amidase
MSDLLALSARAVVGAVERGEISPLEVLDAVADRLELVEPLVNAVPTVSLERARQRAGELMARRNRSGPRPPGWLGGLPVTVKDVVDVAGLPTTYGSEPCQAELPTRSDPLVRRLERRGALVVGKTNVPEFLAGADTANAVFGRTLNPWDPAVSCGASSGGAAVSVATGTSWCAHGEDTAGSIRIPASFCSVVGLRPTPGLVPTGAGADPVPGFAVHGPLARDVPDATLFLEAMLDERRGPRDAGRPERRLRRVAFSADLNGSVPTDPEIAGICAGAVSSLAGQGYESTAYGPPAAGVHEACLTLLAHRAAVLHGPRVDRFGDRIGSAVHAEVAAGRALSPEQVARAYQVRAEFARRMGSFFADYDVLVLPAFGCSPWPVGADSSPFPAAAELAGIAAVWPLTTLATMAGCPALTVPCGRTAAGHPVGLQLIGAPGGDFELLATGRDVERSRGVLDPLPVTPAVTAC